MEDKATTMPAIIALVWERLCMYLQKFWSKKLVKVRLKQILLDQAREDIIADFGSNAAMWTIHELGYWSLRFHLDHHE
jgi:hypothetical protein